MCRQKKLHSNRRKLTGAAVGLGGVGWLLLRLQLRLLLQHKQVGVLLLGLLLLGLLPRLLKLLRRRQQLLQQLPLSRSRDRRPSSDRGRQLACGRQLRRRAGTGVSGRRNEYLRALVGQFNDSRAD